MKPSQIADKLGRLQADIAELNAVAAKLKQELIDAGVNEVDGKLFHAVVSKFDQTKVDYKGLIERLQPSRRLLTSYTTTEERTRVTVTARHS